MGRSMGFDFGLEKTELCIAKKNRWLFRLPFISATDSINSLPPSKASRPGLSFKEMEVQHLNETIYFPSKPDWKPIVLTLYDLKRNKNPVFNWFKKIYNPCGEWTSENTSSYKLNGRLEMYDGCGEVIETWIYENAWPQTIEFGDLDMASSDFCTIDITLRYDRAFIETACTGLGLGG